MVTYVKCKQPLALTFTSNALSTPRHFKMILSFSTLLISSPLSLMHLNLSLSDKRLSQRETSSILPCLMALK